MTTLAFNPTLDSAESSPTPDHIHHVTGSDNWTQIRQLMDHPAVSSEVLRAVVQRLAVELSSPHAADHPDAEELRWTATAIADHPNITRDIAEALLRLPTDPDGIDLVAWSVADNPATDPATIRDLMAHDCDNVAARAADHPSVDRLVGAQVWLSDHQKEYLNAVESPRTPPALLDEMVRELITRRVEIPHLASHVLPKLLTRTDLPASATRFAVDHIDELLQALDTGPFSFHPAQTFILSDHIDDPTAAALLARFPTRLHLYRRDVDNVSTSRLLVLAGHPHADTQYRMLCVLIDRAAVPDRWWADLATSPHENVRRLVSQQSGLPVDAVTALLSDPQRSIRHRAASQRHAPITERVAALGRTSTEADAAASLTDAQLHDIAVGAPAVGTVSTNARRAALRERVRRDGPTVLTEYHTCSDPAVRRAAGTVFADLLA